MTSVTRRRRSRGTEPRIGTEEAIVAAMERLLAQGNSFTSVSVEELAQEAGISRSTFYMHFRDKGELVRRLMNHVTAELVGALAVWFESPQGNDRNRLLAAIRGVAQAYEKHRAIMHAIVETTAYDADVARLFQEMLARLAGEARNLVKRAQRKGLADAELPLEVADALTWMVERCCHQLLAAKRPAQRERVIEAMVHIIWNAIYLPRAG